MANLAQVGLRFALLAAAYLVFAGQASLDECVAAGIAAAGVTLLSLVRHPQSTPRFHFTPWIVASQVLAALPRLVIDSLVVLPRLVMWRTGTMTQEFSAPDGRRHDSAWWAVHILATSAPPNSFVVSRLACPGEVIIHRLAGQ
jgi:hypothetical protein